jgi:hypothetical protein
MAGRDDGTLSKNTTCNVDSLDSQVVIASDLGRS